MMIRAYGGVALVDNNTAIVDFKRVIAGLELSGLGIVRCFMGCSGLDEKYNGFWKNFLSFYRVMKIVYSSLLHVLIRLCRHFCNFKPFQSDDLVLLKHIYVIFIGGVYFSQPFLCALTLEALRGGGVKLTPPHLDFFGFKFLLLDRLSKALAQLPLVYEHMF